MVALTKRSLLVLVVVLLVSWVVVSAVIPDSDGEPDRDTYDVGEDPEITTVETLPDGDYLVGGHVRIDGDRDAVVLRVDSNRSLESIHTFGGDRDEVLTDLIRTRDGGFAFVGWRGEFHGDTSVGWVVNVDANGDLVYHRQFGSPTQYADRVNALVATDNDTIAAVGRTSRGVSNGTGAVLYELDADGDVLLERVYRARDNRSARDILQASPGGYLIVGTDGYHPTIPQYQTDETPSTWLAQVAITGNMLWTRQTHGGVARDIVHANDTGYIVTVVDTQVGISGARRMSIRRLNPQGEVIWNRDAESTCLSDGNPLAKSTDGYVLVRVSCTDDSPETTAIIERWTTQGDLAWNRTFSYDDDRLWLTAVTTREDGTYVAAGTVNEQIWLQTVTATDRSNESNTTTNGET